MAESFDFLGGFQLEHLCRYAMVLLGGTETGGSRFWYKVAPDYPWRFYSEINVNKRQKATAKRQLFSEENYKRGLELVRLDGQEWKFSVTEIQVIGYYVRDIRKRGHVE